MRIFVLLLALVAISLAYNDLDDTYYKTLLTNLEALRLLFGCFVDQSPCNDFAKHAKGHITEVLKNRCKNCDLTQKNYSHVLLETAKANFPDLYEQFELKFDPRRKIIDAVDGKN